MTPSLSTSPTRRPWVGPWLLFVAAGHTLVGVLAYAPVLRTLVERGVFNSIGTDPLAGAAAWFLLFGGPLALLAWQIWQAERRAAWAELRTLGAGILAITVLGVVLMPVSGFWLALPAGVALLRTRRARGADARV